MNTGPANTPPAFHLMAKPTGAACNLACAYCFFLDKETLYPGSDFRMSHDVLEQYIRQLIEAHRTPEVTIAWQGGEPTLMGLEFYRDAIALQERYRRPGMVFHNTLQTNGTLLDDDWCAFFKTHDFLVGVSIDGPAALHDAYRVDCAGGPTLERVSRGMRLLQEHGVEYNVLVAVNRLNADYPLAVYRFLRDEVKATWLQLIPVVERIDAHGHSLRQEGECVSERSVQPEQFGQFQIAIFDEWVRHDVGTMFVQTFESTLRNWMRMPSSETCVFEPTCGTALALEHNGDVYSCDHFVEPRYHLGNIVDTHLAELVAAEAQRQFGLAKLNTLPHYCLECDVRFACHGECPKNRFIATPDGEPGLNYLCAGWQAFFHHIDRPMRIMASLLRQHRPADEVMRILAQEEAPLREALACAGRNDPCPCGSGLKFKHCHGHVPLPLPTLRPAPPRPRPPAPTD